MQIGLRVEKLAKKFNSDIFSGVNLAVSAPLRVGLIGDNGSGKSTFLKILAGLEPPSDGKVVWTGVTKIGWLEQEIETDPYLVSGGEKKILRLTELFYGDYNVLLLDEPDNHLDLEHKDWFEELVKEYLGLVIVISHDRHFLDTAVDQIWHLEEQRITQYKFGYSKFKSIYLQNWQTQQKLWETQEKERLRLLDLVERMKVKAATNDKFSGRLHNAEKRYDRWVDEMVDKPPTDQQVGFQSQVKVDNPKKVAIRLQNLKKAYGDKQVLIGIDLNLLCGQKIAISAPNGSGKSTLLNIICNRIKPDSGTREIGPGLSLGYYAQEHIESLDPNLTMIDELKKEGKFFYYDGVAYLKRFLFSQEQIFLPVRTLSGGQKSRLQLAKFLAKNPDILVLDEPTNHLDLKAVLALENFLNEYAGTVVLVSHDRELVEKTTSVRYVLNQGQLWREKI